MLKRLLILTSLIYTTVLCLPSSANHPRKEPNNYHAVSSTYVTNYGGSFTTTIRGLDAVWSPTNSANLILHAMWIALGDRAWLEVGYTQGGFRARGETVNSYYDGFYTARGKRDAYDRLVDYQETRIIGPNRAEGSQHFFHIVYVPSTNSWRVFINNVRRLTYPVSSLYPARLGNAIDVGLESNTRVNYSALWNERSLQYINTSGNFRRWSQCQQYLSIPAFNAGLRISWLDYCTSQYTNKLRR